MADDSSEGKDDCWELEDKVNGFPHDHIIQESAPDRLKCAISLQVMEDPASVVPCGHTFEFKCLTQHQRDATGGDKCPKCRTPIWDVLRLPDMKQPIRDTVNTQCIVKGCKATVKVDELQGHLTDGCEHAR